MSCFVPENCLVYLKLKKTTPQVRPAQTQQKGVEFVFFLLVGRVGEWVGRRVDELVSWYVGGRVCIGDCEGGRLGECVPEC